MSVKEILKNENNLRMSVQILLFEKYRNEFKVIDGLNKHPKGLNFEEWLIDILENA
jgi:hypothetical protein